MKLKILVFLIFFNAKLYCTKITHPQINESVLQSDGKLVIVGSVFYPRDPHVVIVRYNSNGTLDTTFNSRGFTVIKVGDQSNANGVIVQSDGKIVVAGYTQTNGIPKFLLIRCNSDGTIDTTFGSNNNGIVTTQIGNGAVGGDIVVQTTGELVVGGFAKINETHYFAIARYLNDGNLDSSYGDSGILTHLIGDDSQIRSLAIRSNNTVVAGGTAVVNGDNQFALAQYTTSGILDSNFNTSGVVTTAINTNDQINSIKIQSTGEVVAAGISNQKFALARYTTSGQLDATYNGTGIVVTDLGRFCMVNSIAIDSSDRVVIGGTSSDTYITGARYTTSGVLDNTFGNGGVLVFPNIEGSGMTVVIQPDGKIIGTGVIISGYIIGRFSTTGTIDVTFGSGGLAQQSTPPVAYVTHIWEEQSTGSNGGTFTGGAWQTRTLNKMVGDIFNIYISSNLINLDVGKYYMMVTAPAFGVGKHQIRLQNMTYGITEKYGSSAYSGNTLLNLVLQSSSMTFSTLQHTFIVSSPSAYAIQHYGEQTFSNLGFGLATSFTSNSEIYTQVQIIRLF